LVTLVVVTPATGSPKIFRAQTGTTFGLSDADRILTWHRNFAENVGIRFNTPEEYFLGEAPREFTRSFEHSEYLTSSTAEGKGTQIRPKIGKWLLLVLEPFAKKNKLDIVLFCGSPAAGKSKFYWQQLEPLGYARVNQDLLKTVCDLFKLEREFNLCYSETNVSKSLGHIWTKASQWP
jgi:hypothetical protein